MITQTALYQARDIYCKQVKAERKILFQVKLFNENKRKAGCEIFTEVFFQ